MIESLKIIAAIVGLLAIFIVPIVAVIKYSVYKSSKYYKLLANDFGLTFIETDFFGVQGTYKGCTIKVCNISAGNARNKQVCVELKVFHPQLSVSNASIREIKTVKPVNGALPLANFEDFFEVKLPKNYALDNQLRKELIETAILLGFEDNLDIKQDENKAWKAMQSFELHSKNRYEKCKKQLELLVSLNNFLLFQQNSIR